LKFWLILAIQAAIAAPSMETRLDWVQQAESSEAISPFRRQALLMEAGAMLRVGGDSAVGNRVIQRAKANLKSAPANDRDSANAGLWDARLKMLAIHESDPAYLQSLAPYADELAGTLAARPLVSWKPV